ncbi:MAG: BrnA antitoxin family protein [Burkholderiaceae bacterium]
MSEEPSKSYISEDGEALELDEMWFKSADTYDGDRLVRRGRPVGSGTRTPVTIRLDRGVVEFFKQAGPGWQTRINEVLLEWVKRTRTRPRT